MKNLKLSGIVALVCSLLVSCGSVDVTKTASGYYAPTNPASVKILKTRPQYNYIELGTVDASGFSPRDTAKMHNAIRAKVAPLGASAVILTDESTYYQPYVGAVKSASGAAILKK